MAAAAAAAAALDASNSTKNTLKLENVTNALPHVLTPPLCAKMTDVPFRQRKEIP